MSTSHLDAGGSSSSCDTNHYKLLVTGCARSGTKYCALLLRLMQLDVFHEALGRDGVVSWYMGVDASEVPIGPAVRGLQFDQVFHQVRHPLSVIASLATLREESWAFIAQHIPVDPREPILIRAAKYWYYWNLSCERKACWRYRIEDLPREYPRFCELLGIFHDPRLLDRIPNDINTRRLNRFNWHFEKFLMAHRVCVGTRLRQHLFKRGAKAYPAAITWKEVETSHLEIARLVRAKAQEYGYEH